MAKMFSMRTAQHGGRNEQRNPATKWEAQRYTGGGDGLSSTHKGAEMNELETCPKCGGFADNGFSRSIPPSPYFCRACMAQEEINNLREQLAASQKREVMLREALEQAIKVAKEVLSAMEPAPEHLPIYFRIV